jgi:diacylglycerol kinase (ATP)
VARGLIGSKTTLGIVPAGSGNGLARTLGIPLNPRRALEALEGGAPRRMDVGFANGRLFLNMAGAGFDAAVGAEFHAHGQDGGRRGVLSYMRLALKTSFAYKSQLWSLEAGRERFDGRALIVAFANGREYGGGAVVAPRARLNDGILDLVIFEDSSRLDMILNAPRLFLGTIEAFTHYRHFLAEHATLKTTGAFEHHRDGEPEPGAHGLEIRVEPRALEVLVPRPTSEDPEGPFLPV